MLIQIAMNNIEDIEQGEQILRKWQYHLDEDQSYVVLERAVGDATITISGLHPWTEELEGNDEACSCGDEECECHGKHDTQTEGVVEDEDDEGDEVDDEEVDDDEDSVPEESEVIHLGQALFVPVEEQARTLANELMEGDYIGTVSVSTDDVPLADTDAFRALPADTKAAVIAALEELGDVEAYLSMYEVMGLEA